MYWSRLSLIAITLACVVPTREAAPQRAPAQPVWRDTSPHRVGFLMVGGARLHYLDWGGGGPALLLIHGWGSNAHVFDDLAPRLTDRFHVIGLTLRGFGESDTVPATYSLDRYAEDVVRTLDQLHVSQAIIAAHSFGGWVLTETALKHPERVGRAIYLDAAFSMRASDSVVARRPMKRPPLGNVTSAAEVIAWLHHDFFGMWSQALEADYRAQPDDDAALRAKQLQHVGDESEDASTDWSRLTMPALAICALAEVRSEFPWLASSDPRYALAERYVATERRPFQHRECERFRRSKADNRTVELPGHHYVFIWHPDAVAHAIREFIPTR